MESIFTIPDDIVTYFFQCLIDKGKYKIENNNGVILINPREQESYYKPVIVVKDIIELKESLENYVHSLNDFYGSVQLQEYQDLSFFFNNLLLNMTNNDAEDLAKFIDKRAKLFKKDKLEPYKERTHIVDIDDSKFFAQREVESPGLETPYCMIFEMEKNGNVYGLPLVRYSVDHDTCYIYSVQMGRDRNYQYQEQDYKETVNKVNSGLKKYRDVPPNFVLSLALFTKILNDNNVNNIIIPDYLFGRYKNYYGATTVVKSDKILSRILDKFVDLICRMDMQVDGFDISTYPNDVDSFMRVKLNNPKSENKMLDEIFSGKHR